MMPPGAFLQRPARWLKAISRYRATASYAPNFAYQLCIDTVPDSLLGELNLGSWRLALNGAEPVRAATLRRFTARFRVCGFDPIAHAPAYGMAESTLAVSI